MCVFVLVLLLFACTAAFSQKGAGDRNKDIHYGAGGRARKGVGRYQAGNRFELADRRTHRLFLQNDLCGGMAMAYQDGTQNVQVQMRKGELGSCKDIWARVPKGNSVPGSCEQIQLISSRCIRRVQ